MVHKRMISRISFACTTPQLQALKISFSAISARLSAKAMKEKAAKLNADG